MSGYLDFIPDIKDIAGRFAPDVEKYRQQRRQKEQGDSLWQRCANDRKYFIENFVMITNPKEAAKGRLTKFLFKLRPLQIELLATLEQWLADGESGIIRKSRDEGASWLACAFAVHGFLFTTGFVASFGSKDAGAVDQLGNLNSMLERCRFIIRNLPDELVFPDIEKCLRFMNLTNPTMQAQIVGEVGNNMGRSGRSTIYFADEWDFVERPAEKQASLNENAFCKVYISSVAGYGTFMHEMEDSGNYPIFDLHWRNNPDKNHFIIRDGIKIYPWYEKKKKEYGPNLVGLAREVDMSRVGAQEGMLIEPDWIDAATDLILKPEGQSKSGLDVSNSGGDLSIYCNKKGNSIRKLKMLYGKNLSALVRHEMNDDQAEILCFDENGVGAYAVASLELEPTRISIGTGPTGQTIYKDAIIQGLFHQQKPTEHTYPDRPNTPATERFVMLKDELWWSLRLRFYYTHQRVVHGKDIPDEYCISLSEIAGTPEYKILKRQLSQPLYDQKNRFAKIQVDKFGNGKKSPDHAEALLETEFIPDLVENDNGYFDFIMPV